jgi:hypothetical protein
MSIIFLSSKDNCHNDEFIQKLFDLLFVYYPKFFPHTPDFVVKIGRDLVISYKEH